MCGCHPQAFHSKLAVQNYPLKARTEKELEDIRRVQNMRTIEKAAAKVNTTGGLDSD